MSSKATGIVFVLWVPLGLASSKSKKSGLHIDRHDAKALSLNNLRVCLGSASSMIKALYQSWVSLKKYKPDVICGFGGYGAFPVVLSAVVLKYPTMIHEQNVIPGRANKLLAGCVKKIAISFKQSTKYIRPEKTVLTGCPCQLTNGEFSRGALLNDFHLEDQRLTILVMGGSQGSHRINQEFIKTVSALKKERKIQVIHISGQKDFCQLMEEYKRMDIPFALFEFLDNMAKAYFLADVVISRSGAVSVTEIGLAKLPAIFIPYPYAKGHQIANALVLEKSNIVRIIEEKDLSSDVLRESLLDVVHSRATSKEIEGGFEEVGFMDATQRLTDEILKLGERS